MTISENATILEESLWYSTGGANYSNPSGLGYEVCWIALPTLSNYALGRASADDSGSCSAALDQTCVDDISNLAEQSATSYIASLSPAEMTTASQPNICSAVERAVIQKSPSSCNRYFNNTGGVSSVRMLPRTALSECSKLIMDNSSDRFWHKRFVHL